MPSDTSPQKPNSAASIQLAVFRQIHHLPLVWQGEGAFDFEDICKTLQADEWQPVENPLRVLAKDRSKPDRAAFNEFVYFHDFVRDFLYPHRDQNGDQNGGQKPFRLFEKRDPGSITATFANDGGTHDFTIERLTLHLFRTKVAILTVETLHDPSKNPLTLAQAQTIIDHFRRSYTPYWSNGAGTEPRMVPLELCLSNGTKAEAQKQSDMVEFLENNRATGADADLLEPWKSWISPLSQADWRSPSDERVPVMSFLLLKKNKASNRETLNQIEEKDWYRLAEADESGGEFAYNPGFLEGLKGQFFYDRFMPDPAMSDALAARHVFGGAHYCVVSVDDWFPQNILQSHFRRHYEKMALIARFESASLLAFSSRITALVKTLEGTGNQAKAHRAFRGQILTLHQEFLEYTHRYRFTGISSQIQAGEMFAHWRASLGLDRLYQDVKAEITSAAEFSHANLADEKAAQGNRLAGVGFIAGGILGGAALLEFNLIEGLVASLTGWAAARGWENVGPGLEFLPAATLMLLLWAWWAWWGRRSE